jgi:hypothetical protein
MTALLIHSTPSSNPLRDERRTNMTKFPLALVAIFSLALAACGGSTPAAEMPENPCGGEEAAADENPCGGDEEMDENPCGGDEEADENPCGGDNPCGG